MNYYFLIESFFCFILENVRFIIVTFITCPKISIHPFFSFIFCSLEFPCEFVIASFVHFFDYFTRYAHYILDILPAVSVSYEAFSLSSTFNSLFIFLRYYVPIICGYIYPQSTTKNKCNSYLLF